MINYALVPLRNSCPLQDQDGTCRASWNVLKHSCSCLQNSDEVCGRSVSSCADSGALMLSVKLSPQPSSSVSYLSACWSSPSPIGCNLRSLSEDERFLRCLFHSMRLLDDSLELRLDDRQHTFNPRPFFLSSLVRRIGCVLDRFNSDLNGRLVELRHLLNHELESVKTFPSGGHNCCIRKRFVVPLRACLRQDVLHLVTISVKTPGTSRSSIAEPSRLRDSERYTSDGVGYQRLAIEHTVN